MGTLGRRMLVGVGLVVVLGACSEKSQEPFRDAPVSGRNEGPARIITFPDGFSNQAAKCDGPNMVYSPFKGDQNRTAVAVAANDPRCAGSS